MAKAFPKTLYMKIENGGSGPDYFNAYEDVIDAAEMGEKIKVGVYVLSETQEVKGVVVTNTITKARQRKVAGR